MTHIVRPALTLTAAIVLAAGLAACSPLATQPEPGPVAQPVPAPTPAPATASCPAVTPCPACPACVPPKPPAPAEARYEATPWEDLPGWTQAVLAPSLRAFVAGCARAQARRTWQAACADARKVDAEDEAGARAFLESAFSAYRIIAPDGNGEGLVTGYYEPVLKGRRSQAPGFRHPVYGLPDDLIVVDLAELHPELRHLRLRGRVQGQRLVPYYSRAEIEAAPAYPAKPLAWVADAVELFFMQIQGSGLIEFSAEDRVRLGFADQNGHPYRSLGRYLIDRGELKLEQASMQGIKAWGAANPGKLREALNANPSYVFFRELAPPSGPLDGPPGALGVPLTPGYSIAADPRFVPTGTPVYLATTFPLSSRPLERLVMAQDTGGAIRGAIRADFFWGTGDEAGAQAGRMRQQGRMWLLWPRGDTPPKPQ